MNTWRSLASPFPGTDRDRLLSRWTGTRWIVFGQFRDPNTGNYGMDGRSYDPGTDTWTNIPKVPVTDLREAAVEWSPATGELVVFGGVGLKNGVYQATNETWVFTVSTNTWLQVANSPLSPRMASHTAWDGHRIVFAWGIRYEPNSEEYRSIPGVAAYDPVTATWEMLADPPVRDRMAFAEHTVGTSLAAFWGGHPALGDGDFWLTLHDGAVWDHVADGWQTISDPGLPGTYRSGFATWSANGRLYVVGGANTDDNEDYNVFADGAEWDPATSTWQSLPLAPQSRTEAVAVWTGCDAIVYGGDTPGGMILRLASATQ